MLKLFVLLAWTGGGGIPVDGQGVLAWAFSSVGVDDPSDPESTFSEHTDFEYSQNKIYANMS